MNYDNQRHGEGKLTTTKYVRYGEWRNDKFTGWGIEAKRNGESIEGRFVNGLVNGKGIFINKEGDKYIGDLVNLKIIKWMVKAKLNLLKDINMKVNFLIIK